MALYSRCFRVLALLTLIAVGMPMARPVFAMTYTVSSAADSGVGSLREAITLANSNPGSNITFSVAGPIVLASALPAITADGTTIDGLQGGVPKIEIQGNGTVTAGIVLNASDSVVRGLILNGFSNGASGIGVLISAQNKAANGNVIEKCYIGTNAAGTAVGYTQTDNNITAGVQITNGAGSNKVRDNIIAGNGGFGVDISNLSIDTVQQNNNIVTNNRIGLTVSGAALGNTKSGVQITFNSNNNVIGPDNIISGNGLQASQYGVFISGKNKDGTLIKGNLVQGNKIGTDPTGMVSIANRNGGVLVGTSDGTVVGGAGGNPTGTSGNRGNLISGNTTLDTSGVRVQVSDISADDITNTVIQNNWIGINLAGTAALKNDLAGVQLAQGANGVTVTGNVLSGNFYGVYILENGAQAATKQTRNNIITGNLIGTNPAGTSALPNELIGVFLRGGVWNNTISNNRISGNKGLGIDALQDNKVNPHTLLAPYNNTITGNQIGTLVSGAAIGNGTGGFGINLELGANSNVVSNNVISGHTGTSAAGVIIQGSGSANNQLTGNTISGNGYGVRITTGAANNLLQKNVVQNNTTDGIQVTDVGTIRNKITQTTTTGNGGTTGKGIRLVNTGNSSIATPTVAGLSATTTSLAGTLTTSANCAATCTVEVFDSSAAENFEGPFYLTSFTVTGSGAFTAATTRACQRNLTFTITDATGNTSEFSASQAVASCTGTAPQIGGQPQLTPTTAAQTSAPGTTVTFQHQLTNVGTASGTFSIAVSGLPASWNPTVSPSTVTLNPGDPATLITVSATIPAGTDGGSYVATVTVTTQGNSATASATDTIQVPLTPGLTFTPAAQAKNAGAGQTLCYDHTLTNTANGADTFAITVSTPNGWTSSVQPGTTVSLAKGASTTVTVCLAIPGGTAPNTYATTVTAQSNTNPKPSASATDTTTIIPTAVPQFDAAQLQTGLASATVSFAHVLKNVGNTTGDFDLTIVLPAGFTLVTPPITPVNIVQNETANVTYAVQLPPQAIAGDYNITLRATARDVVAASATVVDVVRVDKIAALALTPDQSTLERPFSVVTYTQTLRNDGNFTDTVTLAAAASLGWGARVVPPTVNIPPFSSLPVNTVVTIPLGQRAGVVNVTNVTATSSLAGVSASAKLTTTIDTVAGTLLAPAQQTRAVEAGKTVTFTFALTNSGSIDQSYSLEVTGAPITWTVKLTPVGPVGPLAPGEGAPLTLVVTTPPGIPDGTIADIALKATSSELNKPSATAIARVRVGPPFKPIIEPDNTASGLPGTLIRYTHVVTNAGFNQDTIVLSAVSNLGWRASVVPNNVSLPPDGTAIVTVTVSIPSSAEANAVDTTIVTARSTGDSKRFDIATDRTTALQIGGVDISPGRFAVLNLGQLVTFQHSLTNLGNGNDQFIITATQDLDWSVVVTPTETVSLGIGIKYPIEVRVQIPANAPKTAVNHIRVRATSRFDPKVFSELVNTIAPIQTQVVVTPVPRNTVYLPVISRNNPS